MLVKQLPAQLQANIFRACSRKPIRISEKHYGLQKFKGYMIHVLRG